MNGTATAPRITGRLIVGALLILFGVVFTLDNLGVLDAGDVLDYWPLILIGIGIWKVRRPLHEGQRTLGWVLIVIGSFFLLQILVFHYIRVAWPVVLVVVGGLLIWKAVRGREAAEAPPSDPGAQSDFAFMGGVNRAIETSDYRGGAATAIMGSVELDLKGATIAASPAVLEVFAMWGGIELTVPPEWKVDVQATPILGAFENKARTAVRDGAREQVLVVRGAALMGGVEIKN